MLNSIITHSLTSGMCACFSCFFVFNAYIELNNNYCLIVANGWNLMHYMHVFHASSIFNAYTKLNNNYCLIIAKWVKDSRSDVRLHDHSLTHSYFFVSVALICFVFYLTEDISIENLYIALSCPIMLGTQPCWHQR